MRVQDRMRIENNQPEWLLSFCFSFFLASHSDDPSNRYQPDSNGVGGINSATAQALEQN